MHTDWTRAVQIAADVLAAEPELEEDAVVSRLEERGLSEHVARVTVMMVVIAFGRVLLSERDVTRASGVFYVQDANGAWLPFELALQPAFVEATQLAVTARHRGLIERDAFDAIATRSAELGRDDVVPVALPDVGPELFVPSRPWWKFW